MTVERMDVTVLLAMGREPGGRALIKTPHGGEQVEVDAALVSRGTGFGLEELPGKRLVALVDDGELVGFERRAPAASSGSALGEAAAARPRSAALRAIAGVRPR